MVSAKQRRIKGANYQNVCAWAMPREIHQKSRLLSPGGGVSAEALTVAGAAGMEGDLV
jgi:hypothetical protein